MTNKHSDIDCTQNLTDLSIRPLTAPKKSKDVPFDETRDRKFRDHLDPSRLSVPR